MHLVIRILEVLGALFAYACVGISAFKILMHLSKEDSEKELYLWLAIFWPVAWPCAGLFLAGACAVVGILHCANWLVSKVVEVFSSMIEEWRA